MKISNISNKERWNSFKAFDKNLVVYFLLLFLLIFIFQKNTITWFKEATLHLFLAGLLLIIIPWLDKQKNTYLKWIRYWYLIAAFPFLYWDLGKFIHLVTPTEFDPLILKLEQGLFGTIPNIWVQNYVTPVTTEFMQISYSIYWITIPLGGAIFYFTNKIKHFEQLVNLISLTFFLSYFSFIFFPVVGPRFYIPEKITASYNGIYFTGFLRSFMENAGFRGGAFPSSHVAVAVVILIFIWKFKPKIAKLFFLPMVVALSAATVFGQYHYFTDVIGGFLIGLIIGFTGSRRAAKILLFDSREAESTPNKTH
jgi:membrane-associated phospholipid phosphatase